MATSDLHMAVLGYDYASDQPRGGGLARLASLIAQLRAEGIDSLLVDNGDLLQGNALGDWLAETRAATHPMIAAMNALGYDAATLGNHDIDHGLDHLSRAMAQARFPVVASNLRLTPPLPALRPEALLTRRLRKANGEEATIRIGILGVLPPQTLAWGVVPLAERAEIDDICAIASAATARLRAQGADLVIALCHSGLGPDTPCPGLENAAAALRQMGEVDAVIAGHSHLVAPDPGGGAQFGRPPEVALVQPGSLGSHLGVIDLDLHRDGAGAWQVAAWSARAIPVPPDLPEDDRITALAAPVHDAARRHLSRRVGWTEVALGTAFALVAPSAALGLIAAAHRSHVAAALRDTPQAGLPVLTAVAPFKAGGRGGPDHYTRVAAGPLTLRALDDLYTYPNHLACTEVTGAELADWLERSASVYARLIPGLADQPLLDPAIPPFECDALHGVSYGFDLTQPARFDRAGRLCDPAARRLVGLCHGGQPVRAHDRFVVATNDYRLATRGLADRPGSRIFEVRARDVLRRYLEASGPTRPVAADWRLLPAGGATAIFDTSPHAADCPNPGIAHLTPLGPAPGGFARFRLHL